MRGRWGRTACVAAILASGCGHSREPVVLTLDYGPPAVAAGSPPSIAMPHPLKVAPVAFPPAFDRPEVVRQTQVGRLAVDDFARWGAPISRLATTALEVDLMARLPGGSIRPSSLPPQPGPTLWVAVDGLLERDGSLIADGAWTIRGGAMGAARGSDRQHAIHLAVPILGTDPAALATALSRVLALVADDVAATAAAEVR